MGSLATSSVIVQIAGERYIVRSDADETYVRTLAQYVDQHIDNVRQSSKIVPTHKLAILAALNVADELFQAKRQQSDLKQRVKRSSRALLTLLDREEKRLGGGAETI